MRSNLPIKILGEDVTLVYRQDSEFDPDGIELVDVVETRILAKATIEPGVPEQLQPEVGGDRWDDFRTFYVADRLNSSHGQLSQILQDDGEAFNVSRIEDWSHYFVCLGERQA